MCLCICIYLGFCDGSDDKDFTCIAEDLALTPGPGRYLGDWNDYPPHYSCLENPMDRGAWWATVHGFVKS